MEDVDRPAPGRAVALIPWGDVWDDFLDSVGVSLEAFCEDGIGGWLLGYMEALRLAGIRTVLILMSARIEKPFRVQHRATGATISVLPAPRSYRAIRRQFANSNPYLARTVDEMTGRVTVGRRRVLELLNLLSPYIATPPGRIAREVRRQGCAAILCQDYETPRFDVSILIGRLLNIPVLACFQSGCYDSNRIGRSLRPLTMKACSGLVVAPQAEIERVRDRYGVPSDRIAQIFNPVDAHFWRADDRAEARAALGVGPDDEVVIWHGRVDMQAKRLDVLLDAWQSICSEHPGNRRRLLLLGTGEDAQELERRIDALTVTNVRWLNTYTTDRHFIRRFLSAGDVYAFPSVFEGFPVAPLEAMACGLPLVAAAASGIPEILEGGESSGGLLVPRGDVAAFTSALRRTLEQPEWRRELGVRARRRIENACSIEAVSEQFRVLFDGVLRRASH
jgi:glycosyltransferase involved in cell wall biosynthesis